MSRVLITRAKLSEIAGVSRMAITKACAEGKRLNPALSGKYVDATHPEVVAYLKEKGATVPKEQPKKTPRKRSTKPKTVKKRKTPHQKTKPKHVTKKKTISQKTIAKAKETKQYSDNIPDEKDRKSYLTNWEAFIRTLPDYMRDDVRQVENLSVGEFVRTFGSQMEFKQMADGLEKIQKIYKLTVENKKSTNELIDRAILTVFVEIVNGTHNKLLRDGALSMASIAERRYKAGCSMEDVTIEFRKQLGKFFAPMKEKFKRRLEDLDGS